MRREVVMMLNSQMNVCLICIVDCSFIIARQERIAIENAKNIFVTSELAV